MLLHVITLIAHEHSEGAAMRCMQSALSHGLASIVREAFTPADEPLEIMRRRQWPTKAFTSNRYSRPEPCAACFLSHASCWETCVAIDEPLVIAEHDALMVRPLPELESSGHYLVNLCQPSFGKWKQPPCGIGPLISKPHMPGATAYYLHPKGARLLLEKAATEAEPTDVFLSLKRFPFIRESFPYSFICDQHFTTIQNPEGCRAKHQPVTII